MPPDSGPPEAPAIAAAPLAIWKSISPLRGAAMLLVVANHAIQATGAAYVAARHTVAPEQAPVAFATLSLLRGLTPACLLAFVFASGFSAYRFMRVPKQARAAAGQLLRKYLAWSLALGALGMLAQRRFDGPLVLRDLALGSTMPAYWFLTLLIPLTMLAPWLARVVERRPRLTLAAALILQLASFGLFYGFEPVGFQPSFWMLLLVRPLRFLPAFLAGMLVSRDAEAATRWLAAQRRWLLTGAGLAALACLGEATLMGRAAGYSVAAATRMYATERVSLFAFATLTIATVLAHGLGGKAIQAWLTSVGNASLGILFLMDVCMMACVVGAWQLPRFIWEPAALAFARHELPAAIRDHALWFTPVLFAVGLWGPLQIMERVRARLGNRARWLW
jgi:hypothetical protein